MLSNPFALNLKTEWVPAGEVRWGADPNKPLVFYFGCNVRIFHSWMVPRSPARLASHAEVPICLFLHRFGWFLARIKNPEPQISNLSPLSEGAVLKSHYFKVWLGLLLSSTSIINSTATKFRLWVPTVLLIGTVTVLVRQATYVRSNLFWSYILAHRQHWQLGPLNTYLLELGPLNTYLRV